MILVCSKWSLLGYPNFKNYSLEKDSSLKSDFDLCQAARKLLRYIKIINYYCSSMSISKNTIRFLC